MKSNWKYRATFVVIFSVAILLLLVGYSYESVLAYRGAKLILWPFIGLYSLMGVCLLFADRKAEVAKLSKYKVGVAIVTGCLAMVCGLEITAISLLLAIGLFLIGEKVHSDTYSKSSIEDVIAKAAANRKLRSAK